MEQVIDQGHNIKAAKAQTEEIQNHIDEYLDEGNQKRKPVEKLTDLYRKINKDLIKRLNSNEIATKETNVNKLEKEIYALTGIGYKFLSFMKSNEHFPVFKSSVEELEEALEELDELVDDFKTKLALSNDEELSNL